MSFEFILAKSGNDILREFICCFFFTSLWKLKNFLKLSTFAGKSDKNNATIAKVFTTRQKRPKSEKTYAGNFIFNRLILGALSERTSVTRRRTKKKILKRSPTTKSKPHFSQSRSTPCTTVAGHNLITFSARFSRRWAGSSPQFSRSRPRARRWRKTGVRMRAKRKRRHKVRGYRLRKKIKKTPPIRSGDDCPGVTPAVPFTRGPASKSAEISSVQSTKWTTQINVLFQICICLQLLLINRLYPRRCTLNSNFTKILEKKNYYTGVLSLQKSR